MKKINTNPLEGMKIENIATELNDITLGKYVIFVDLYNGIINIGKNSRKKHNELVIGEVEFLDKSKKKIINKFYPDIRNVIQKYHHSGTLITRTKANYYFGKEYVEKFRPVFEVKNPYYSCAAPMCLYDVNVLNYYKGKLGVYSQQNRLYKSGYNV